MPSSMPPNPEIEKVTATSSYDEEDIVLRVLFADVISQANTIEFGINDLLAMHDLWREGGSVSKAEYLEYVEKRLTKGVTLKEKGDRLLMLPEVEDIFGCSGCNIEIAQRVFAEWRRVRNRFAHGMLVDNGAGTPTLYYNGYSYSISESAEDFLFLNEQMIAMMGMLQPLSSPYRGSPVFLDEGNTPDNPRGSDQAVRSLALHPAQTT